MQNFTALATAYPDHELVDDSLFWVANLYEHYLSNNEQAIRYYRSLTKRYEDSEYYFQAMAGLARVYAQRGDEGRQKALLIYQKLQKSHLPMQQASENQIRLAEIYLHFEQYGKARVELKRLIEQAPNSDYVPRAYHLIGLSFHREGRRDLAEITYLEVDQRYDFSKTTIASALSLAQLYEESDRLQSAIAMYESILKRLDRQEVFYLLANDRIKKLRDRRRFTSKG